VSRTVLIVDDELDMRIFLTTLVKMGGYRALTAREGGEAVETARKTPPDLMILDIMMPGEGGVRTYRNLRTDPALSDIPVMVLSAVSEKSFQHYLTMLNVRLDENIPDPDGYVEKPPEPEAVLALIRDILSRH